MKFVFWEIIVSTIEISAIRGLAERGHECTLVVNSLVSERRAREGWPMPDPGAVRVVVADPGAAGTAAMRGVMDAASPDTIHVLGGCHFCRTESYARGRCVAEGRRFGMVAEGGINLTWRRWLRRAKAAWYARKYRHRGDFLLAMGTTGVGWYRRAGYPSERVFPYQYTVENIPVENIPAGATAGGDDPAGALGDVASPVFRMVHVGTFDHRKGTDLLLRGLLRMAAASPGGSGGGEWRLTMVGDGPLRAECERMVSAAGVADRVEFTGFQPSAEVYRRVQASDLVVVPSRHDGWCAVVNEALQQGTPVLCSDRVGAACVVRDAVRDAGRGGVDRGGIYPCYDSESLASALRERIAAGAVTAERRRRIREWSERIQGPAVAAYFEAVMRCVYEGEPRPLPPWESDPRASTGAVAGAGVEHVG